MLPDERSDGDSSEEKGSASNNADTATVDVITSLFRDDHDDVEAAAAAAGTVSSTTHQLASGLSYEDDDNILHVVLKKNKSNDTSKKQETKAENAEIIIPTTTNMENDHSTATSGSDKVVVQPTNLTRLPAVPTTQTSTPGVVRVRGVDYRADSSQASLDIRDDYSSEIMLLSSSPSPMILAPVSANLVDEQAEARREQEIAKLREALEEERRKTQDVVYAEEVMQESITEERTKTTAEEQEDPVASSATTPTMLCWTKKRIMLFGIVAVVVIVALVLGVLFGVVLNDTEESSGSICFDGNGTVIPGCICHESCSTCKPAYEGVTIPNFDIECLTCADGSDFLVRLNGTGLCGRTESEDQPCFEKEYALKECLAENDSLLSESCKSCDLIKDWLDEVDLSCREIERAKCDIEVCCPDRPCADKGFTFEACYYEAYIADDPECPSEECSVNNS